MHPLKVLIHYDQAAKLSEILREHHADVDIEVCSTYEALPATLNTFKPDIMFGIRFAGTPGFPRAAILATPSLRWISVGGSGTDHLLPWDSNTITVTNGAGVASDVMAQYVIGMMLTFALKLPLFQQQQKAKQWLTGSVCALTGATVLIIGLGHTGRALAQYAKAMGMHVIGVRANPVATPAVDEVYSPNQLAQLWRRADYIALCIPLTAQTRYLLDEQAFAACKQSAVLVDVSRGGVVSEQALLQALRTKQIAGAALDVFEQEPLPTEHPFWTLDNLMLTPHCSSVYEGWDERAIAMFCANLDRFKQGKTLENIVDPVRGY